MNKVTPVFDCINYRSYDYVTATLSIGECSWRIIVYPTYEKSNVIYNEKELENLKKTLRAINVEIDEYAYDKQLFDILNEEIRINEAKKEAEKLNREKIYNDSVAALKEEVKCFNPLAVKILNLNHIEVSDGISTISITRDEYSSYKGWTLDNRVRDWSSNRKYYYGTKKSSLFLSKLVDFANLVLKTKTDIIKSRKSTEEETELNDIEMTNLGWSFAGSNRTYNNELKKYEPTSDNGKYYSKNGVTVEIKRENNAINIVRVIIKDLLIPVEEFKSEKYI